MKERPCIVKTLDVEPVWVGFYCRNRLVPVQKAITGVALANVGGVVYQYLNSEGIVA